MKKVPLQDLKQHLSSHVALAEAGEEIVVTRHGKPVVLIRSALEPHVTLGSRFGKAALKPLFTRPATRGRYLALLEADRRDEIDAR